MSNEFITTDSALIYNEVVTSLEYGVGEPLYPGDERRIFAEAMVPLFVSAYNAMNDAARQKMLRYARGEVLDALGERVGVYRLPATEATTVLRFSLASEVGENVLIPEGTRATGDSTRYFATTGAAVIDAGKLYVDVAAKSIEGGSIYNDIAIGAINVVVDLIPYVDHVSNIEVTAGGDEEEGDDSLRERIRLAPTQRSTAGSVNGYRYWALSADSNIADVKVKSEQEKISRTLTVYDGFAFKGGSDLLPDTLVVYPEGGTTPAALDVDYTVVYEDDMLTITLIEGGVLDGSHAIDIEIEKTNVGVVKLIPICKNGELPDEAIIAKVLEACSASEVRPVTDKVIVEAPKVREYDIELTYYTTVADESACIQTVEGEGGAIDQYIEWQSAELGRDIDPDELLIKIKAPAGESAVGAMRVVISSPEFTKLDDTTIARFSGNKIIRHEVSG